MYSTSYEKFLQSYCTQLATATNVLKHIKKSDNVDTKELIINDISKIYDKIVIDYIDKCIDKDNIRTIISISEIADVALNNKNRNGTEMKMILNAIEDIYHSFCRHTGEDSIYEF